MVLSDIDKTAGVASVAISCKAGQESLHGAGIVASIKMKTLPNFAPKEAIQLDLENIVANDQDGITYTLAAEALSLTGACNFQNSVTPDEFKLYANYPNPFNPITTISYSVAKNSHIKLKVYNTLGQVVAVLVDGFQAQGTYSIAWDAGNQPSGLYLCRFEADGFSATKKMFLQK